jgi:hypothetical protein
MAVSRRGDLLDASMTTVAAGEREVGQECRRRTPIAGLVVEQQGEPSMAQCRGFAGCFDLAEGLGHSVEPELAQEVGAALTGRPTPPAMAGKAHPPANQARIVALATPVFQRRLHVPIETLHSAEAVA